MRRGISYFGIQRSGNHAVIAWILDLCQREALHLNHCFSPSPFHSFTSAETRFIDLNKYAADRKLLQVRNIWRRNIEQGPCPHNALDVNRLRTAQWKLLIVSWENKLLFDHAVMRFYARHLDHVPNVGKWENVLVLRDAYNLFASLKKWGRLDERGSELYPLLYKQYAKEYLNPGRLPNPTHFINYNRWCSESAYRVHVAHILGFQATGEVYSLVPGYGGGSSFTGTESIYNRGEPSTLNRWMEYADDASYKALFDSETIALTEEVFGIGKVF